VVDKVQLSMNGIAHCYWYQGFYIKADKSTISEESLIQHDGICQI
jgi:hypothetical protein